MTEQTAPTTGTEETNTAQAQQEAKEFKAITSQDDFDKAIQARIAREREKFADYDDLKSKATKLTQIEEAQKTEQQKLTERAEKAEQALAEKSRETDRLSIVSKHSIPAEFADLVQGSDDTALEASAAKVAALLKQQGRLVIPSEGKQPLTPAPSGEDWLRTAMTTRK